MVAGPRDARGVSPRRDGCWRTRWLPPAWLRWRRAGDPGDVVALRVDLASLARIRRIAGEAARRCGLGEDRIRDAVIVASELATNVIRHGGGKGRIWLRCEQGTLRFRVTDRGPGLADPTRACRPPPDPMDASGRGLWMVQQLSQGMTISTGRTGTTVTTVMSDGGSPSPSRRAAQSEGAIG